MGLEPSDARGRRADSVRRLAPAVPLVREENVLDGDALALQSVDDLLRLDQDSPYTCEQALGMYLARYGPQAPDANIRHIVEALGYLDDVSDDPGLPASRDEIARYWRRRQPEIVTHLDRWGLPGT